MNIQEKSYIYGLLITDGNLYVNERKGGKITLELSIKDRDICEKLFKLIPGSTLKERIRDTNFKKQYHSIAFINYQLSFRQEMINFGFPLTNKTNLATTPKENYSERDFWRGVIDGDGSVGYTSNNFPFVSLVTKSESLKEAYCSMLLKKFGIEKNISRNKRDNVYNIVVYKEEAQQLINYLYLDSELYLNRKYQKAMEALEWKRPDTMRKVSNRKAWDSIQDEYILTHSIEDSMRYLNRTKKSIQSRLFRLNHR